jgi:hypothetical protein
MIPVNMVGSRGWGFGMGGPLPCEGAGSSLGAPWRTAVHQTLAAVPTIEAHPDDSDRRRAERRDGAPRRTLCGAIATPKACGAGIWQFEVVRLANILMVGIRDWGFGIGGPRPRAGSGAS